MTRKGRIGLVVLGVVLLLGGTGAFVVWNNLFRKEIPRYDDIREFMKYGSLGQDVSAGIPFRVWQVLPEVFPDLLPPGADPKQGYAAFGFVYEKGKDIPIGITRSRVGFDRISLACAACHNSHYRARSEDEPTYFLSGTDTSFDGQRYFNFMFACASDPRFNADTLMPAIEKAGPLGVFEGLFFRHLIIDRMKDELLQVRKRLDWWYTVPEPGPGRWIAFNDLKFHFAQQPRDGSIGNPDVPTLFNLKVRQDIKNIHWDAFTDDVNKAMQNAAVGAGAVEETIPRADLDRLRDWWMTQPAPKYPFPVDATLAARGKEVWNQGCAGCHEIGHAGAGRVIPIDEIGTDRHRYDLITPGTVEGYNRRAREMYGWPQPWFIRKTEGYLAVLLDAVWLRAPYLHNGSVPTIADLLEVPENRPKVFYRGYDLYDSNKLGYVSAGSEAEKHFRYDTALPGNGNQGHLYGTDLPADDKVALTEYLKTL